MAPTFFYCFDAYCGWCYGFSPVIKQLAADNPLLPIEVLSGGMILPEVPAPISLSAGYIQKAYKTVEELTGIRFGPDYLWHINNPGMSDWYPHSEKPAIAMCIFKEYYPARQVEFAADLLYALHFEGRDLTDNEAYRHLLEKYSIQEEVFYTRLASVEYKEQAHYEFQLCKELQVTGYPSTLLQVSEKKFHLLSNGFTDLETMAGRLASALPEKKSLD